MSRLWISGNKFTLLENGEAFFPRVFEVIAAARHEVLIETFILREDKVGNALHAALRKAARRGVQVDLTVDGFGSHDLSRGFLGTLAADGVRVRVFAPVSRYLRKLSYFRRMHRKLVTVDGACAFVGGINFGAEHLADYGPGAKQDYAVEIEGPIVPEIQRFMQAAIEPGARQRRLRPAGPTALAGAEAMFVWRDNGGYRHDIEHQYRLALRLARRRVVIASAYFFPGHAFLRELCQAARRGVEVALILQGNPDMRIVRAAALLYDQLLRAGVRIYEYCERPLHSKVALVDEAWATVGSSNLDPLSLAFNLEANVMIRDRAFNQALGERLQRLMERHCRRIEAPAADQPGAWGKARGFLLSHLLRRYPSWASHLPARVPRLALLQPASGADAADGLDETAFR